MKHTPVYRLTVSAILSALALALSFLDHLFPPLPVPGAHLGLANLVVMFALAGVSFSSAAGITVVKSVYALLRGPIAALMSLVGGVLALLAMAWCGKVERERLSFIGIGIVGAAAHNVGQLLVSVCLLGSAMWYYTPILLVIAIPTGALTGCVLNIVYPHLNKMSLWKERT